MKRLVSLLLSAAMLLALLSACGPDNSQPNSGSANQNGSSQQSGQSGDGKADQPDDRKIKDTLTVAFKVEAPTLDTAKIAALCASTTNRLIFDWLFRYDDNGELVPEIATAWEQVDETTYTFTIRDDVYFSNGEKLTAEDVEFSLERLTWMNATRGDLANVINVDETKALDETTVQLKLNTPYAPMVSMIASPKCYVVCKSAFEEMGEDAFGRTPVGSGPMVLSDWISGDSIILKRNEDYWGEPVAYETFIARTIVEASTRAIEVETGGVDISLDVLSNDMANLEAAENAHIEINDGVRIIHLGFNMNLDPVADVRVRQAFAHALDLETIVAGVYAEDTAVPATSVLTSTMRYYENVGAYEYNPEKAKELLAEAGYEDGLTIDIWCVKDDAIIAVANVMQPMLAEAGITANIVINDTNAVNTAGTAGDIPIWLYNYTGSVNEPMDVFRLFRKNAAHILNSTDDKLEELMFDCYSVSDEDERAEACKVAQEYIKDQCYMVPIVSTKVIYGVSDNVEGFYPDSTSNPDLRGVVVYK